jgi:heme/copper-type cytochrome/quinol oxidase subunit 3
MEIAVSAPSRENKIAGDGVIGMILVLATEAMFFAGLISAYIVNRAGAMVWPPANQPRLPIEITAVNTFVLIASAVSLFIFNRKMRQQGKANIQILITSIILGGTFLVVQGIEWVRLIGFGLTTSSSLFGAFFYTIIGLHAAHVLVGITILLYLIRALKRPVDFEASRNTAISCSLYWYFVVAVWPVLYTLVYLN